jgi:hypothetical protein
MHNRRRNYLCDKNLQGRIARQIALWWMLGGALILGTPVLLNLATGLYTTDMSAAVVLQKLFVTLGFPITAGLILMVCGMRMSIKFSNRIAGPLYRLNREITNLNNGCEAKPINLRKGDFLTEIVDNFNQLSVRHNELMAQCESPCSAATDEDEILGSIKDLSDRDHTCCESSRTKNPQLQLNESTS